MGRLLKSLFGARFDTFSPPFTIKQASQQAACSIMSYISIVIIMLGWKRNVKGGATLPGMGK